MPIPGDAKLQGIGADATTAKSLDCVALKNEIQERMRREFSGLSDTEERARIQHELATSESPVARKWRELRGCAPDASPI